MTDSEIQIPLFPAPAPRMLKRKDAIIVHMLPVQILRGETRTDDEIVIAPRKAISNDAELVPMSDKRAIPVPPTSIRMDLARARRVCAMTEQAIDDRAPSDQRKIDALKGLNPWRFLDA